MDVRKLVYYYRRVLKQKYLFYLVGQSMGVGLLSRLTHNFDLLSPKYAMSIAPLLYREDGTPRVEYEMSEAEIDRLNQLILQHKSRNRYCIEYWIQSGMKSIPDRYMREFLADRFADCGLDKNKLLMSNRDLFFKYGDKATSYDYQVRQLILSQILEDSSYEKIRSHMSPSDVSSNGEVSK